MKVTLRSYTILLATSLASGAIGCILFWSLTPSVLEHRHARSSAMLRQAQDFPDGGIMIVGDSLTEFTYISELCNKPVFNAGLAGSRVSDWKYRLPQMLKATRPAIVIFALGLNDAARSTTYDPQTWREDYRTLIAQVHDSKVVIVGVQPIEPYKLVSNTKDTTRIDLINRHSRELATELGLRFIEPLPSTVGKTYDGVHLNRAGRPAWRARLAEAC